MLFLSGILQVIAHNINVFQEKFGCVSPSAKGLLNQLRPHLAPFNQFNLSPITELGKGALWMLEPRHKPRAEHAGIHSNPKSGDQQVPSHRATTVASKSYGGDGAKALTGMNDT